ncbi:M20/M25/M40 family metallo-hydrolase [Sphingomonas sp.]|uniref:M20/M25/M40 family metallo-hydrolase n=1 Tax=Sphingomonas sp. TaxID=28214 RepID=UPI003D6CDF28
MIRSCVAGFAVLLLSTTSAIATPPATPAERAVAAIANSPSFAKARATLDAQHDQFVAEIIKLTEIPAPPFKEAARAAAYTEMFRTLGLRDVTIDPEGNVTGIRPGSDPKAPMIVMSAHLDTVFPEGTVVTVRREGTKLHAPGIGDDTRGLGTLLAYIRALDAADIRTRHSILFVGTVGEEGRGDLRGVRHLLTKGVYKDRIGAFFSVDGSDPQRVTHGGVGSKRYHVVFKGPGGHSYGAFGIVNPMVAMSQAVTDLYKINLPGTPKTTYAASVTGGGTSVNAIPSEVFMDFDMRSADPLALADLEKRFLAIVKTAADNENKARSIRVGSVTVDPQPVGDRPAGSTSRDAMLVQTTAAAIESIGYEPIYDASSTDSNIAMSIGIPAVTIGSGGVAGRAHSADEWIDVAKPESLRGMTVGLLALLTAAEMAPR